MSYTEIRQFNINSRDGHPLDESSVTSFTNLYYNIPGFLCPDQNTLYTTISVLSFSCSVSWFLVTEYNDDLWLNFLSKINTFKLIHGVYNAQTFMAMVLKVLQPNEFTMSFDISSGCFTLTYDDGLLACDYFACSSYALFGAPKGKYVVPKVAAIIEFPLPANLAGPSKIVLTSDIQTKNYDTALKSSFFCSVDINAPFYETVLEENVAVSMLMPPDYFVDSFYLKLSDENGYPIDMRGVPYFLTIEVKYTRSAPLTANRGLRQILTELADIIQNKSENTEEEKDEENQIDVQQD